MAVSFLNVDVSELCIGKPELKCVSASATISDALTALRTSGDSHVSVWLCCGGDSADNNNASCVCVGKFGMADAILFLCREENRVNPFKALESPVSDVLPNGSPIVRHLEPNSSFLDAIDCILEGTQNLVIPIQNHHTTNSRKNFPNRPPPPSTCTHHNGRKYCWLTQEDVVRFLLNSLGAFSPIPTFTIDSLNITDHDIMTITYNEPASSALPYFCRALTEQTSVAVVDERNRLIGEISPFALSCSNETAAGAITVFSAVDLMTYVECARPPEDLVQLVKTRLRERNLVGMVEMIDEFLAPAFSSSSSCSSDDESWSNGLRGGSGRSYSGRRSEAIVCGPRSSLVAVMIQALAHRVSCVWVVDEGYSVVGAVTFAGILKVFGGIAGGRHNKPEDNLFIEEITQTKSR